MASASAKWPSEKAGSLLDFVEALQTEISKYSAPGPFELRENTIHELEKQLSHFQQYKSSLPASFRRRFGREGVKLWNMSIQVVTTTSDGLNAALLCKVKALAFEMLGTCVSSHEEGNYKVLGVALKAARQCIEHQHLELTKRIVEKAAERLDILEKMQTDDTCHINLQSLTTEYYMIRIYLSWLEGRPDIADHLFSKIQSAKTKEDQTCIWDICFKIGNQALLSTQYGVARKWLERAVETSDDSFCESHGTSLAVENKKLLSIHALVRAYIHLSAEERARCLPKTFEILRREQGNTFPVLVVQLEMMATENTLNQQYSQVLRETIDAMKINDSSLKIVFHYIQRLKDSNVRLAVEHLIQLLIEKLLIGGNQGWTEKAFLYLIWALSNANSSISDPLDILGDTVEKMSFCGQTSLSEDTSQACLMLIWKHIDKSLSNDDYSSAQQWTRFALEQHMFQISGENRAKLLRKFVLCSMKNAKASAAYNLFEATAVEYKNVPPTLYLMYKLALQDRNYTLGGTYLEALSKDRHASEGYFLPCAIEALRQGNTDLAMRSAQQVVFLHKWDELLIIIEESSPVLDTKLGSIFLECILRSDAPMSIAVKLVKNLILTLHTSTSAQLDKSAFNSLLPRYLHLLFQLSLDSVAGKTTRNDASTAEDDYTLSESILDEALILAHENKGTTAFYPLDEIQWLSTVAFNKAVDFFLSSKDDDCKRWAEKAIRMADSTEGNEGAMLGKLLRGNLKKLLGA